MKNILKYLIVIILSVGFSFCTTVLTIKYNKDNTENVIKTVEEISIVEENTIKESINKIYDSTVYVETYKAEIMVGSGSGFVYKIDDNFGYILTNNHVIENSTKVNVTNTKGDSCEATILGSDTYLDLAVLAIPKDKVIKKANIGESTLSELGDTVFTVGSPMGKDYMGSVTKGIISGKNRQITVNLSDGSFLMDVIQIDAAINPGNSGGPLSNINGEVIGITSAKLSSVEGMGFVIPIEMAMSSIEKLEHGEKIERPAIGASLIDASNTYSLIVNKIKINSSIKEGSVIAKIVEEYPADKAGLKIGDVIIEVNGEKVKDSASLKYLLYKYEIGSEIKVKYNRDGINREVTLLLDKSLGR